MVLWWRHRNGPHRCRFLERTIYRCVFQTANFRLSLALHSMQYCIRWLAVPRVCRRASIVLTSTVNPFDCSWCRYSRPGCGWSVATEGNSLTLHVHKISLRTIARSYGCFLTPAQRTLSSACYPGQLGEYCFVWYSSKIERTCLSVWDIWELVELSNPGNQSQLGLFALFRAQRGWHRGGPSTRLRNRQALSQRNAAHGGMYRFLHAHRAELLRMPQLRHGKRPHLFVHALATRWRICSGVAGGRPTAPKCLLTTQHYRRQ